MAEIEIHEPKNDGEKYIKLNDLLAWIEPYEEYVKGFILERVQQTTLYEDIDGINKDDIPLRIHECTPDTPEHYLLKCRLEDKEPDDLNILLQVLWDTEFDTDDYRQIGFNDGEICMIGALFNALGLDDRAKQVNQASYGD